MSSRGSGNVFHGDKPGKGAAQGRGASGSQGGQGGGMAPVGQQQAPNQPSLTMTRPMGPGGMQQQPQPMQPDQQANGKRKRKLGDKMILPQVRELVPESQAYMDLVAFEQRLDSTIARKKLEIQENLKRPMKVKRRLRIFVSHTFYPSKPAEGDNEEPSTPQWELRVEGKLLDDSGNKDTKLPKRKFSSFFKSLVIELDKDLYGPDSHLVEWHRTPTTNETDGFQVKRPGDRNVQCTILLLLDYQPMKYKLHPRLAKILGLHTETRARIIEALWQYIKTHKLQDGHDRDHVNCDAYLQQVFECPRMRFMEIPQRLSKLLHQPDPIAFQHIITVDTNEPRKTACYDIDVEIDDMCKAWMTQFVISQANQKEIAILDDKIYDTVDQINEFKLRRDFYLSFSADPQQFIQQWLQSQSADLKTMTETDGDGEERRSDFFAQDWSGEAVARYWYNKAQVRRVELEHALGIASKP